MKIPKKLLSASAVLAILAGFWLLYLSRAPLGTAGGVVQMTPDGQPHPVATLDRQATPSIEAPKPSLPVATPNAGPSSVKAPDTLDDETVARLYECKNAPDNAEEFDEMMAAWRIVEGSDPARLKDRASALRSRYEKCQAIPAPIKASAIALLAEYADVRGDDEKLRFVYDAEPKYGADSAQFAAYQRKSREYLKELEKRGNADVLKAYSTAYARGSVYARDPTRAYSYMYAYVLAMGDVHAASALVIMENSMDSRLIGPLREIGVELSRCCLGGKQ